jgi:two-component system cell cycle response regulator DivK
MGAVGQKILVVEDNELNLKLFCDLLRAHGYAAEPVRDGREAVERARSFGPDLIVMDIQMPYISGLELIEQLKADAALRHMPIMAVTAYAAKGDEERIRDAGAEGYVSKPISVVRFVEAVRALLAVERPTQEAKEESGAMERVRVERLYAAPCERVFDSWLDQERAGNWLYATPDGETVRVEIDARVGGRYEIVERRDGEDVLHTGVYEEMDRPRRLAFTLLVPKFSDDSSRVAIDFAPEDEGCRLVLDAGEEAAEDAEKYRKGWSTILEGLAVEVGERKEGE